jgi:hypothetical protein
VYRFKDKNRTNSIYVRRSVTETDTIVYGLPDGYLVDKVASDRNIETEFGMFKTSAFQKEGKLYYTRFLKLNKGTFPPSSYGSFEAMVDEIRKADGDRVVIKPGELSTVN